MSTLTVMLNAADLLHKANVTATNGWSISAQQTEGASYIVMRKPNMPEVTFTCYVENLAPCRAEFIVSMCATETPRYGEYTEAWGYNNLVQLLLKLQAELTEVCNTY